MTLTFTYMKCGELSISVMSVTELDPTRPKWEQIHAIVIERIASGEYPVNSLVSEVALAEEFDVARATVRKATARLREAGYLRTHHGMGSFVLPPKKEQPDT